MNIEFFQQSDTPEHAVHTNVRHLENCKAGRKGRTIYTRVVRAAETGRIHPHDNSDNPTFVGFRCRVGGRLV